MPSTMDLPFKKRGDKITHEEWNKLVAVVRAILKMSVTSPLELQVGDGGVHLRLTAPPESRPFIWGRITGGSVNGYYSWVEVEPKSGVSDPGDTATEYPTKTNGKSGTASPISNPAKEAHGFRGIQIGHIVHLYKGPDNISGGSGNEYIFFAGVSNEHDDDRVKLYS